MTDGHHIFGRVTEDSINSLFGSYARQLKEGDKDIYPMDVLSAAVNAMFFAIRRKHLKPCLNTEDFHELFEHLTSNINNKPDPAWLSSRGFTAEDLETINDYSELFHEMSKNTFGCKGHGACLTQ
jgi:hypothetical protein